MPFADVQGSVAGSLQRLRQGHFRCRHAQHRQGGHLGRNVVVEPRQQCRTGSLFHPIEEPDTDSEDRRELEPEPGGVAASHQCGPRGRTDGIAGISVGEHDTVGGDGVDVRRREATVRGTAVAQRDVVVAEVIGQDNNDVRQTIRRRGTGLGWAWLPLNRPVRSDGIAPLLDPRQREHHQLEPEEVAGGDEPGYHRRDEQSVA